jgi:hypothetical protein
MKISLKSLVATAALAVLSLPALAQVTVPPQPAPGPIPGTGAPNGGGLMVVAWDAVRGVSVSQYLGLTMDQFLPSQANAITAPLNFGTLGGWDSIFTGSAATDIRWAVFAGDQTGTGSTANRRLMTTSTNDTVGANSLAVNNSLVTVSDFTNRLLGTTCNNGLLNPCNATASSDPHYAGRLQNNLNDLIGGGPRLPFTNTSLVGDSMAFWLLTTVTTPTGQSTIGRYESVAGLGRWLLNAAGGLSYALPAIPLPAGVWLLMSGLAGFAAVGRRKNQAAVAA